MYRDIAKDRLNNVSKRTCASYVKYFESFAKLLIFLEICVKIRRKVCIRHRDVAIRRIESIVYIARNDERKIFTRIFTRKDKFDERIIILKCPIQIDRFFLSLLTKYETKFLKKHRARKISRRKKIEHPSEIREWKNSFFPSLFFSLRIRRHVRIMTRHRGATMSRGISCHANKYPVYLWKPSVSKRFTRSCIWRTINRALLQPRLRDLYDVQTTKVQIRGLEEVNRAGWGLANPIAVLLTNPFQVA